MPDQGARDVDKIKHAMEVMVCVVVFVAACFGEKKEEQQIYKKNDDCVCATVMCYLLCLWSLGLLQCLFMSLFLLLLLRIVYVLLCFYVLTIVVFLVFVVVLVVAVGLLLCFVVLYQRACVGLFLWRRLWLIVVCD